MATRPFVTILQSVPEKRHNSYLIPQADTKNRKTGGDAVFNIIYQAFCEVAE